MQEIPLLVGAFMALLGSTASQTAAPFFFGLVVDAAQKSMGNKHNYLLQLASEITNLSWVKPGSCFMCTFMQNSSDRFMCMIMFMHGIAHGRILCSMF